MLIQQTPLRAVVISEATGLPWPGLGNATVAVASRSRRPHVSWIRAVSPRAGTPASNGYDPVPICSRHL